MKYCVFLITGLSLVSAFNLLVPHEKELVYSYSSLLRTGTNLPKPYASEFYLNGKLHVQRDTNSILVRLSDLTFKLYNGKLNEGHETETDEIPLPQECDDLLRVFRISYNPSGQTTGIATEEHEEVFARNMKKAIAAVLQLDLVKLGKSHAFVTTEQLIYGNSTVGYNVLKKNDHILVQKMLHLKSGAEIYQNVFTNIEFDTCEVEREEALTRNSQQRYVVAEYNDGHIVKQIESQGTTYLHPFQANSAAQYAFTKQNFVLTDINPIQEHFQIYNEQYENSIAYTHISVMPGVTYAQQKLVTGEKVTLLYHMLQEFVLNLDKNMIYPQPTNFKRGKLMNSIVYLLASFDMATLDETYTLIQAWSSQTDGKYLEVFHKLLPLIGTHPSVVLVKRCIYDKLVEEKLAVNMLQKLPFHVRTPTEKILKDLEDILSWESEISWKIRKAAILSFTTLVYKTFKFQLNTFKSQNHESHQLDLPITVPSDIINFFKQHTLYVDYVAILSEKLKAAQDHESQFLYIWALFNTRVYTVAEHLLPIIRGHTQHDYSLRLAALWAISPLTYRDHEKIFEVFWPILINHQEPIEVRGTVYQIIVESHPPLSRLLDLNMLMQNEPNEELYHMHYTFLKTLSESTEACHQPFRLNAAQALKFLPKPPEKKLSGYYQADYRSLKYGFGNGFHLNFFNFKSSKLIYLDWNVQMMKVNWFPAVFLLHITDLNEQASEKLDHAIARFLKLFDYKELCDFISTVSNKDRIHIDVAIASYDQMINVFSYSNATAISNLLLEFLNISESTNVNNLIEIDYDLYTQIFLPTDLGIPVVIEALENTIYHKQDNTISIKENGNINVHLDKEYSFSKDLQYGLAFHNPVADIWQGIGRFHSYNFVFPLCFDVNIDIEEGKVNISLKKSSDDFDRVISVRNDVLNEVYVKEDKAILTKSCLECHSSVVAVAEDRLEKPNYDVPFMEIDNTGYKIQAFSYDDHGPTVFKSFKHFLTAYMNNNVKSSSLTVAHILPFAWYWYNYITLQPATSTGGFVFNIMTNKDIELAFRINKEIAKYDLAESEVKFEVSAMLAAENETNSTKWDARAEIKLNNGHSVRTVNMDIDYFGPNSTDLKICIDDFKKWLNESVPGYTTIVMSPAIDTKCIYSNHSMKVANQNEKFDVLIYDITFVNQSTKVKQIIASWLGYSKEWDLFNCTYSDYDSEENKIKICLHSVDSTRSALQSDVELNSTLDNTWTYMKSYPKTTRYSNLYEFMQAFGLIWSCMENQDADQDPDK